MRVSPDSGGEMPIGKWSTRTRRSLALGAWSISIAILSGCAVGPSYQAPELKTPADWQAPLPHAGAVTQMLDWWGRFNDPRLTALLQQAEADSPSLDQAWAAIVQARSALSSANAQRWPALSANASATRQAGQLGSDSIVNSRSVGLDASWELDLFGRVKRAREAAEARLQARENDWHDARTSLAAEVANTYVQFRGCQLLAQAYQDSAKSQQETARITSLSVGAGFTSAADGALAEASAASSRAAAVAQQAECDVLVKALVALTGSPDENQLRQQLGAAALALPLPTQLQVASVPADLIRQRPDLASAERELAAATADIGSAQAERFPNLSLSGSIAASYSSALGSTTPWSFGPGLSLPLFDAGQRKAAVSSAEAARDTALARYRQAVRDAVKEVEQALVRLDSADRRSADAKTAASGYQRYLESIDKQWRAGGVSLLSREEAHRAALTAQINLINLQLEQVQQWVALYKALGGGWREQDANHASQAASSKPSRPGDTL